MAEKKFATPDGAVQSAELTADYERARKFDAVRVGKLGVYYRSGLKTVFLAYPTLERAFIRIQEVNGRMCCGSTTFAYYRLVLIRGGKEYAEVMSESESAMDAALAAIHENAPELPIGVADQDGKKKHTAPPPLIMY